MKLRDDEESATENNNNFNETPPQPKPVPNEDRHVTCDATHTAEAESTKQNADKAISCNPTATDKRSRQEGFEKQLRESSEKKTFSGQFDGAECQILIETESWRTAKNWNSDSKSSEIRTSQGNYRSRTSIFFFSLPLSNVLHTCSVLFSFPLAIPRSWFKNLFMAFLLRLRPIENRSQIKGEVAGSGSDGMWVSHTRLSFSFMLLRL